MARIVFRVFLLCVKIEHVLLCDSITGVSDTSVLPSLSLSFPLDRPTPPSRSRSIRNGLAPTQLLKCMFPHISENRCGVHPQSACSESVCVCVSVERSYRKNAPPLCGLCKMCIAQTRLRFPLNKVEMLMVELLCCCCC